MAIDILEELKRIQSLSNLETFDRATDSLEAISNAIAGLLFYGDSLFVDANPAVGNDANPGTRQLPFLTIQAAVNAAPEYTNIFCIDSRVGAAAVGFDENTQIGGVIINTNYLTIIGCGLQNVQFRRGGIPIANSIANADHIFSGAGRAVAIYGFDGVLPNVNGDEEVISLTGDGALVEHCNILNPIVTPGFRGIVLPGDNCQVRHCRLRVFDDDGIRLEGGLMDYLEDVYLGDCLQGIHLLNGCHRCVLEHVDLKGCTTGILIDAGALWTQISTPHFHNNTNDVTNNGGATNAVIDAHETSQIVAEQTIEQDHKDIFDEVAATSLGKLQIAATTIDLNQGVATYVLFTGTTQDVVIEGLTIRMPNIVAGGALVSISIQTNDTTPQIFITAAEGAVANLTAEAQLSWAPASGITLLKVGKTIGLSILGGAHGVAYVCDVIAKYRAVVSGGYLA